MERRVEEKVVQFRDVEEVALHAPRLLLHRKPHQVQPKEVEEESLQLLEVPKKVADVDEEPRKQSRKKRRRRWN